MATCAIEIEIALEKLRSTLRRGELSVRFADGRQVTYKSTDELLKAIRATEAELESAKNRTTGRRRAFGISVDRGL